MQKRNKESNRRDAGSGVVWALAVAGFLLIIVTAVLTISLAYHNRSLRNDDQRQAYLTARSGVDMVAAEFTAGSSTAMEIYSYLKTNDVWTVDDVGFAEDMGSCALTVRLEQPASADERLTLTITADAEKGKGKQSITATLVGVETENDNSAPGAADTKLTWYITSYEDGKGAVSS